MAAKVSLSPLMDTAKRRALSNDMCYALGALDTFRVIIGTCNTEVSGLEYLKHKSLVQKYSKNLTLKRGIFWKVICNFAAVQWVI